MAAQPLEKKQLLPGDDSIGALMDYREVASTSPRCRISKPEWQKMTEPGWRARKMRRWMASHLLTATTGNNQAIHSALAIWIVCAAPMISTG